MKRRIENKAKWNPRERDQGLKESERMVIDLMD
jgi:hypothetical protein